MLALAAIYEGATRSEAARIGGVTLQIVRDWVLKFNAHGPDGLVDRKAPGQPSRLNDTHRYGPTWYFEAKPCIDAGTAGEGCVNHPDNQFLVVTRGEGEIMACAADDVPVAEGRCGTCQLIVGSSLCQ